MDGHDDDPATELIRVALERGGRVYLLNAVVAAARPLIEPGWHDDAWARLETALIALDAFDELEKLRGEPQGHA